VAGSFLLFLLAEYSVWIGMLVYAYSRGGAGTAGVVAVAQLLPGVVVGPLLSTLADRHSPVAVLVGGYLAQSAAMVLVAVVIYVDGPAVLAYAAAVVAATAVTATRPAQAVTIPGLARSADELTMVNAGLGWCDNLAMVLAGAITGAVLTVGSPATVFSVGAACTASSAVLVGRLSVRPLAVDDDSGPGTLASVRLGLAVLARESQPRVLVALMTAVYVVIGALDVLFVVLAISVLHRGSEWAGYLNTAEGLGGLAAVYFTVGLVGRRLGPPLVLAVAGLAAFLTSTAFVHTPVVTIVLLAAIGVARTVLDTAIRTLLQRTVRSALLGRIFGVVEGASNAGLAIGSLLVGTLVEVGGPRAALIGTALVGPLTVVLSWRAISGLDAAAQVPIVEISLLRSMPHFRLLPSPELEGLAGALRRVTFEDGDVIIRQGDEGHTFYAVAEGVLRVSVDGIAKRTLTRPAGVGEIALLRQVPRTATVTAQGPAVLYALDGEAFLTVVTGHAATRQHSEDVASDYLRDRG
jgi:predicted MFS family arabinose efflux permease